MITIFAALAGAIGIDLALGDPPNRYHPVAWIGKVIGFFIPRLKGGARSLEKARGAIFAIGIVVLIGIAAHLLAYTTMHLAGAIATAAVSTMILKVTIAVRGMEKHSKIITDCLESGDLVGARRNLALIVRRKTDDLDERHILSATIECVGESTVDGITGPIFYYSLLGPGGALAYRTVNTLDSMVGYNDEYFQDIGWMSARLDMAANYVPARITAFLMVLSARILGADWKNSFHTLQRDHAKTSSPNAGYPMATMAGALRIRLEKIGHYALGDEQEQATLEKCKTAISIMKLTTLLFCLLVSVPAIVLLYLGGWWRILLGIP
jgi:adenosylcobinamide-phosphate synthase